MMKKQTSKRLRMREVDEQTNNDDDVWKIPRDEEDA